MTKTRRKTHMNWLDGSAWWAYLAVFCVPRAIYDRSKWNYNERKKQGVNTSLFSCIRTIWNSRDCSSRFFEEKKSQMPRVIICYSLLKALAIIIILVVHSEQIFQPVLKCLLKNESLALFHVPVHCETHAKLSLFLLVSVPNAPRNSVLFRTKRWQLLSSSSP